jgi:hypothetical protein
MERNRAANLDPNRFMPNRFSDEELDAEFREAVEMPPQLGTSIGKARQTCLVIW